MMTEIRVRFDKTGRIKYISHLDMYRAFIRAIRRTDIPVWYTEGFNPHVYLNFVLPVPLGCESVGDAFDMRLTEDYPLEKIPSEMNRYLPEGIVCTSAYLPSDKAKTVCSAEYELFFDSFSAEKAEYAVKNVPLTYVKIGKVKGRKSEKTVSISENIRSFSVTEENGLYKISVVLSAGNTININPFEFASALSAATGDASAPLLARRTAIYTPNGVFE